MRGDGSGYKSQSLTGGLSQGALSHGVHGGPVCLVRYYVCLHHIELSPCREVNKKVACEI